MSVWSGWLGESVYFALRRWAARRTAVAAAHLETGERGEDRAYFWLRKHGYTVVARRWRAERLPGDLDLVAWDGPELVIVEVKTRSAREALGVELPGEAAVNDAKQRMLAKMARAYVNQLPKGWRAAVKLRCDVISVYELTTGVEVEHLRNAVDLSQA